MKMIYPNDRRWWKWFARQIAFALMDWAADVKRGGSYTLENSLRSGRHAEVWSPE